MARTRLLHPEFFTDADLGRCSFAARLLYAGLWCLADKKGRLEDLPKNIEGQIFPHDIVDIEDLLEELETGKFVVRYKIKGGKGLRRYISIPNFSKHQHPHPKEAKSSIPPPLSISCKGNGLAVPKARQSRAVSNSNSETDPNSNSTTTGKDGGDVVVVKNQLLKALAEEKLNREAAHRYVDLLEPECIFLIIDVYEEMVESGSLTRNAPGMLNKMLAHPDNYLERVDGVWQRKATPQPAERRATKKQATIDRNISDFLEEQL